MTEIPMEDNDSEVDAMIRIDLPSVLATSTSMWSVRHSKPWRSGQNTMPRNGSGKKWNSPCTRHASTRFGMSWVRNPRVD
jgi:hypothetical protein